MPCEYLKKPQQDNIVQISDFASNFGINVFSRTVFVVLMSQAGRDGPVPVEVFLFSVRVDRCPYAPVSSSGDWHHIVDTKWSKRAFFNGMVNCGRRICRNNTQIPIKIYLNIHYKNVQDRLCILILEKSAYLDTAKDWPVFQFCPEHKLMFISWLVLAFQRVGFSFLCMFIVLCYMEMQWNS